MNDTKKTIQPLRVRYENDVIPRMRETMNISNRLAVPTLSHVIVHSGVGKHRTESGFVDDVAKSITLITGQRPASKPAKKSIAGFKLRAGQQAGLVVTLRGARMYAFLERLIHIAFPRSRDFRGVSQNNIDASGNLSVGIRDVTVFPELAEGVIDRLLGIQVTVVTTARNKEEAIMLFSELGFPFTKEQDIV